MLQFHLIGGSFPLSEKSIQAIVLTRGLSYCFVHKCRYRPKSVGDYLGEAEDVADARVVNVTRGSGSILDQSQSRLSDAFLSCVLWNLYLLDVRLHVLFWRLVTFDILDFMYYFGLSYHVLWYAMFLRCNFYQYFRSLYYLMMYFFL